MCNFHKYNLIHQVNERLYLKCEQCFVVFCNPESHLRPEEEKSIYDYHENDEFDLNYRRFLSKMYEPLSKIIQRNSTGLDFGCGSGPALVKMFEENGYSMNMYDLFYHHNETVFNKNYDFIVTTETAEHLYHPKVEFNRLWNCLNPHGYLGIMTNQYDDIPDFSKWYYIKDPTHVLFFSRKTFHFLSKMWNATLVHLTTDVVILRK